MNKEELIKAITGKSSELTLSILAKLEAIQVTKSSDHKQAWSLSEDIVQQIDKIIADVESGQVGDQVTGQATGQVTGQATGQVTGQALNDKKQEIARLIEELTQVQIGIIRTFSEPLSMQEIKQSQRKVSRDFLRVRHLRPLLDQGIVLMKYADKPKHPKQKYYLSEYGKTVLQAIQGEH